MWLEKSLSIYYFSTWMEEVGCANTTSNGLPSSKRQFFLSLGCSKRVTSHKEASFSSFCVHPVYLLKYACPIYFLALRWDDSRDWDDKGDFYDNAFLQTPQLKKVLMGTLFLSLEMLKSEKCIVIMFFANLLYEYR